MAVVIRSNQIPIIIGDYAFLQHLCLFYVDLLQEFTRSFELVLEQDQLMQWFLMFIVNNPWSNDERQQVQSEEGFIEERR
ncbi:hypothetical protein ACTXT7_005679 [Hymenolepis weldensis]